MKFLFIILISVMSSYSYSDSNISNISNKVHCYYESNDNYDSSFKMGSQSLFSLYRLRSSELVYGRTRKGIDAGHFTFDVKRPYSEKVNNKTIRYGLELKIKTNAGQVFISKSEEIPAYVKLQFVMNEIKYVATCLDTELVDLP